MRLLITTMLLLGLALPAWGQPRFAGSDGSTAVIFNYAPRIYQSNTEITATSEVADTRLYYFEGEGLLQEIFVNFDRDDVYFILKIDGIEIVRIELEALGDPARFNIPTTIDVGSFGLRAGNSDSQIIVNLSGQPSSFNTSFEILARKSTGTNAVMDGIIVLYREAL